MLPKHIHPLIRYLAQPFKFGLSLLRGLSRPQMRDLLLFARRRLREEKLQQVAGSLTFTTVLAVVPVLTIAFAIFTSFPLFNTFRQSLEAYFVESVMPKAIANNIMNYLTLFASKASRLSAVGAVLLIVTSVAMMGMIERVFNQIWRVKRPRRLARRILVYWAIMTLGPLLIGASLTITSQLFMATSSLVGKVHFIGALFYGVISILLTTGAFTLLYVAVPNRNVDWRDAAWGGLMAALAFEVAKRLFAIFIAQRQTYALIYGALAALPLFLLWVYLSWMITLVGALLVAALPVVKYERWWYEPVPGGAFVDAMAILKVLHDASRWGDSALVSTAEIRMRTRFGYDEMTTLLEKMLTLSWVGQVKVAPVKRVQWGKRVSEGSDHWVLLANLDKLTLADVYRLFVFGGAAVDAGIAGPSDGVVEGLGVANAELVLDTAALARQVEAAVEQGLGQTLAARFRQAARDQDASI
jgi:membrane protein